MKTKTIVIILAAFLFLPSASPWEGAGAVAPSGELPAAGLFVATNSFPRNTVVDITNIETGRSTRAIVANTLNSPGLLAVVSREAAEVIGMRAGSTSRIRMIQPSDPIAYLRFMERSAMGNPEFDSGNVIDEEALLADVYRNDSYTPPAAAAQFTPPPQIPETITGPSYLMEPEWGGPARMNIVDVPGFNVTPAEFPRETPSEYIAASPAQTPAQYPLETQAPPLAYPETPSPVSQANPAANGERQFQLVEQWNQQRDINKDVSPRINERPPIEVVKEVNPFNPEYFADDINKEPSTFLSEAPRDDVIKNVREFIAEAPRPEVIKDVAEREVYVASEPPVQAPPAIAQEVIEPQPVEEYVAQEPKEVYIPPETRYPQYNIVQAEERPPESLYGINPDDIIPGIASAPAPQTREPEVQAYVPPARVIEPAAPPAVSQSFSVRTISALDRGQYYVQVAALPGDAVENAVRQIDRNYDPAIFRDGSNLFRIVIGPLNQGESAAILARFKSIGYRDAFVRRGG